MSAPGNRNGSLRAPSLLRRLVQRSGVMTFEGASDALADIPPPDSRLVRVAERVERQLQGVHDGRVLDIGCWTGGLARALADRVACSYTGVDIEPAAQAVAIARQVVPNQRFMVVASVESLPFDAGSFDLVVLTEVIEHVPAGREGPLLAELARVLRPGGSIILSTPFHNALNPLDPAWFFGHRHYTVERIARLAQAQRLATTDVEYSGGFWTAVDTNMLYFYKHVLRRPYKSQPWLYERVRHESKPSGEARWSTTLWCRLVRPVE